MTHYCATCDGFTTRRHRHFPDRLLTVAALLSSIAAVLGVAALVLLYLYGAQQ